MELGTFIFVALPLWIVSLIAAPIAAYNRGLGAPGFFILALFFGPVAMVLALVQGKHCEACRRLVHADASICPHCHTRILSS